MIENTLREGVVDTCYHEAAHAVFHYHAFGFLGLPIRYVSVGTEEHPERRDICMASTPVEPYWWQALSLATDSLAAEWAVYKRRDREFPVEQFEEFAEGARCAEEDDWEYQEATGEYPDNVRALRMLERAAFAPDMGDTPGMPAELEKRHATVEGCYEEACQLAIINLDCWWPEIVAVAEGLLAAGGYLDGDEVVKLIESARYGEGAA